MPSPVVLQNWTLLLNEGSENATAAIPVIPAGTDRIVILIINAYDSDQNVTIPTTVTANGVNARVIGKSSAGQARVGVGCFCFLESEIASISGQTLTSTGGALEVKSIEMLVLGDVKQLTPSQFSLGYATSTGVITLPFERKANSYTFASSQTAIADTDLNLTNPSRDISRTMTSGRRTALAGEADIAQTIDFISSANEHTCCIVVNVESVSIPVVLDGGQLIFSMPTNTAITTLTIDNVPIYSAINNNGVVTLNRPTLVAGAVIPRFGPRTLNIVAGNETYSYNVNVLPPSQYEYFEPTLYDTNSAGSVSNFITTVIGDQFVLRTAASLGVPVNRVSLSGGYLQSDLGGTQTFFHISSTDNTVTSITATLPTASTDTVPEYFSFVDQTNVNKNTLIVSSAITVSGVTTGVDVPITISGGQYSIYNGSTWSTPTSAAGNVRLGYQVVVNLWSSTSDNTTTSATLNIGGVTDTFSVTTYTEDLLIDALTFTSVTDASFSDFVISESRTITGLSTGTSVSVTGINGLQYSINNGTWINTGGVVSNNDTIRVAMTASASSNTNVTGTLNVGGVVATFSVTSGAADITPSSFVLPAVSGAALNTLVESAELLIQGVTPSYDIAIQVTDLEYNIRRGGVLQGWTSAAGTIRGGDYVKVRRTSANLYSTEATGALQVGNSSATFSVTTILDTDVDDLVIASTNNALLGQYYESETKTIAGISAGATVSATASGCQLSMYRAGSWTAWGTTATMSPNEQFKLRMISSTSYDTPLVGSITLNGEVFTWTVRTKVDDEPTVFSFTQVNNAVISQVYVSEEITVAGIASGVNIQLSVTSCEAQVDAGTGYGAWSTNAVNVKLGDKFRVRFTTGTGYETTYAGDVTLGSVSAQFRVRTGVAPNLNPTPIEFAPLINAPLNTVVNSQSYHVFGITNGYTSPITVVNGEYSIIRNGTPDPWTEDPGVIGNGDYVMLRGLTSSSLSADTIVAVTIGAATFLWEITTKLLPDITPSAMVYTRLTDQALNDVVESETLTVTNVDDGFDVPLTIIAGEYSINNGPYGSAPTNVQLGDTIKLRTVTSSTFDTTIRVRLTLGGMQTTWTVTTASDPDGNGGGEHPVSRVISAKPVTAKEISGTAIPGRALSNLGHTTITLLDDLIVGEVVNFDKTSVGAVLPTTVFGGKRFADVANDSEGGQLTLPAFQDGVFYPPMGNCEVAVYTATGTQVINSILRTMEGYQYVKVSNLNRTAYSLGYAFSVNQQPLELHAPDDGIGILNDDGSVVNWPISGQFTIWARMPGGIMQSFILETTPYGFELL